MTDLAPRTVSDLAADQTGAAGASGPRSTAVRVPSGLRLVWPQSSSPRRSKAPAEPDTHRHIHKDNNVLFPAALAALDSLTSAARGPDEEARP